MAYSITLDNLSTLREQIVRQFQPEQIILFGSQAYGTPNAASDFDILVVMDHDGRNSRKSLEIAEALGFPCPVDLIVRKPYEVKQRYDEFDPIIRAAINKGRVLYERDRRTVA
jgi:predicted nucleotidyltransferase